MLHAIQQLGVLFGSVNERQNFHSVIAEVSLVICFVIDHVIHSGDVNRDFMVNWEYLERHLDCSILEKDFEKYCDEIHCKDFTLSQEI